MPEPTQRRRYYQGTMIYGTKKYERASILLKQSVVTLPSDYQGYGCGTVERWEHDGEEYPDCSCGCRWAVPLDGDLGMDWNVCTRPDAPHAGGVVFEHQTGKMADGVTCCFESDAEYKARRKRTPAAGEPPTASPSG